MHNNDLKIEETIVTASKGIHYFIFKIQELLRLSANENDSNRYLDQISEKIRRIRFLGTVKGDENIENLAFHTSITLQNILKYSEEARQEFYTEIKYFLAALKSIAFEDGAMDDFEFPEDAIHDPEFEEVFPANFDANIEKFDEKDDQLGDAVVRETGLIFPEGEGHNSENGFADSKPKNDDARMWEDKKNENSNAEKPDAQEFSWEKENDNGYLDQIANKIQEIKNLGISRGNEYIIKLAVNTSIALRNILKYEQFDNEEINTEYKYFLTALNRLSSDKHVMPVPEEQQEETQPNDLKKAPQIEIDPGEEEISDGSKSELDEIYEEVEFIFSESDPRDQSAIHDEEEFGEDLLSEQPVAEEDDKESGWIDSLLDGETPLNEKQNTEDNIYQEVEELLNDEVVEELESGDIFTNLDELDANHKEEESLFPTGDDEASLEQLLGEGGFLDESVADEPDSTELETDFPVEFESEIKGQKNIPDSEDAEATENINEHNLLRDQDDVIDSDVDENIEPVTEKENGFEDDFQEEFVIESNDSDEDLDNDVTAGYVDSQLVTDCEIEEEKQDASTETESDLPEETAAQNREAIEDVSAPEAVGEEIELNSGSPESFNEIDDVYQMESDNALEMDKVENEPEQSEFVSDDSDAAIEKDEAENQELELSGSEAELRFDESCEKSEINAVNEKYENQLNGPDSSEKTGKILESDIELEVEQGEDETEPEPEQVEPSTEILEQDKEIDESGIHELEQEHLSLELNVPESENEVEKAVTDELMESESEFEEAARNEQPELQTEQEIIAEGHDVDSEQINNSNEVGSEPETEAQQDSLEVAMETDEIAEENIVRSRSVGKNDEDENKSVTKPGVQVAVLEKEAVGDSKKANEFAELESTDPTDTEKKAAEGTSEYDGVNTDWDREFVFEEDLTPDNTAIGLDISAASVKVVVLKNDNGELRLVHWRIYDLDPNESEEERRKNIKHIWASFLNSYKQLKKLPVVTSLIDNSILIRYLVLPYMSDANFMKSAVLEIQSELFLPEDQVKIITHPYPVIESKKSKQKTGILLAIENKLLDQIFTLIKNANIKISRVCIDSFAMTQYFSRENNSVRTIIDLGAEKVKLVIVKNKEIRFARNIDSYEKSITAEIADYMGIALKEAEDLKRQLQFVTTENDRNKFKLELPGGVQGSIQNVAYPLYSNLTDEIQLTLQYYNSNNSEKIESVELIGGGALLKGIDKYMAYSLNLPVIIADIKNRVTVPNSEHGQNIINSVSPKLAVAVGLAQSQLQPAGFLTKIDLRKKFKIKNKKISFSYVKLLIPIGAFILLTIGVQTFFKIQTSKYQKNLEAKNELAKELSLTIESLKKYEDLKGKLDTQVQNIRSLKSQQPKWSKVMKIISQNIPNAIWLNQFNGKFEEVVFEQEEDEMSFGDEETTETAEKINKNQYFLNLALKGQTTDQYRIQDFISRVEKDNSYRPIHFSKIINQEIPSRNVTKFDADGKVDISGENR